MQRKPEVPPERRRAEQGGFTLIEVIVVLVILGILAAFAIPRFANVSAEARQAAIRGLAGGLRSSSALVHGLAMARGLTAPSGQSVTLEGASIELVFGYPAAAADGIGNGLINLGEFTQTASAGKITYVPRNAPATAATCRVIYIEATAAAAAQVHLHDSDCK